MIVRSKQALSLPFRQSQSWGALRAARRRAVATLIIGASLLLAACGAADANPDPTGTPLSSAPLGAEGTASPPALAQAATATRAAQSAPTATPAATQTPRPLTTPTPIPPPVPAIGDSVRTDGWVFSITEFETIERIGEQRATGMFLYLRMTISNTGSSATIFPYDGLIVVDHEDRTFFLAEAATSETMSWDFGFEIDEPFQAGETRNVAVAFDIALDSSDLTLTSPSRVFEIRIEYREPPK